MNYQYTTLTLTVLEQTQEQLENDLKINLSDMAIQSDIKGTVMSL